MLIDEKRWQSVWCFLSLDQTRPFFEALWVPIKKAEEFQTELRGVLADWLDEESYYGQRGPADYQIADWFRKRYGRRNVDYLICWARNIFLYEGPDRMPETVWSLIPFKLPPAFQTDFPVSGRVLDLMGKLKEDQQKELAVFEPKLPSGNRASSKWDKQILALKHSRPNDVTTTIKLMRTYNIFLESWERHCSKLNYSELHDIWEWGKHVAPQMGMQDLQLAFPGSWRLELQPLLTRKA